MTKKAQAQAKAAAIQGTIRAREWADRMGDYYTITQTENGVNISRVIGGGCEQVVRVRKNWDGHLAISIKAGFMAWDSQSDRNFLELARRTLTAK